MNMDIVKRHFLGKKVRILKGELSLYGDILEAEGDSIVFKTRTQTSVINIEDIKEMILINDGDHK